MIGVEVLYLLPSAEYGKRHAELTDAKTDVSEQFPDVRIKDDLGCSSYGNISITKFYGVEGSSVGDALRAFFKNSRTPDFVLNGSDIELARKVLSEFGKDARFRPDGLFLGRKIVPLREPFNIRHLVYIG